MNFRCTLTYKFNNIIAHSMYEDSTQSFSTLHPQFTTVETAPSVAEKTDTEVYSGVLVVSDPSGLFDTFSFTETGEVEERGDIITKINQKDVNTNKHLQTILSMYTDNDIITIKYMNKEGIRETITVKVGKENLEEATADDRKYFGESNDEQDDFDIEESEVGLTPTQKAIRYIALALLILLLIVILSGSILRIVSIVLEINEINGLISNLT